MNIRSRSRPSSIAAVDRRLITRAGYQIMSIVGTDAGKPAAASSSDTRQRILNAAMRCFSDSGFHNASMQQICAAANMSPGGVYRYFASKDEIIGAIFEHVHARNTQYFERMAAEGATLESFCEVGFSCLRDLTEGPERSMFCEVFAEAQRNPQMRGVFEAKYNQALGQLRAALSHLQSIGEIDKSLDVSVVATLLMAIGDGLIVRKRVDQELQIETLWPALHALLTRMLRPSPAVVGPTNI
jgi:TetR/AcrR family transcriptional regulator, repressor for uid operon